MKTREHHESVRPKELFELVRNRENSCLNLRVRMILAVSAELFFCILVAVALGTLLRPYLNENSYFWWLVILVIPSIIVGPIVSSIISKVFLNPIKKLGEAMERIADGDFTVRLEDQSTSKELMEVYTGFNMMAHELGAIEVLQSDFVSNVSHEFKTPINAIEGYSTLLQGSENLDAQQSEYIEKILFNTQRLSSLVSSILLLSKLENRQIQTNQTTYRLDEQIRQSIVAKEPEWEKKDIEFDVDMDAMEYTGNESMMRHVWDNLIGNAIKFSPHSGTIRMHLSTCKDTIQFTIDNSGPGLSEEAMKHIYDKFYQADSSHKEEGNGLGLALVKRILVLEKGSIQAENLPNCGCRFTVSLRR